MKSHIDNFILRKVKERCYNTFMNQKIDWKKIGEGILKYGLGPAIAVGIAVSTSVISDKNAISSLEKSVEGLNTRIDDLNKANNDQIEALKADIGRIDQDMSDAVSRIEDLNHGLGVAEGKLSTLSLQPEGQLAESIMQLSFQKDDEVYYSKPKLGDGVVAVGLDLTEYTAEELQNKPIIVAYKENGQDVFFMGQFDEHNQWDGECLINVYQDGNFVIATEALYNSGKREEYEQLFPDNGRWIYSKRVDQDDYNGGDTWTYELAGNVRQRILFESPEAEDMIRPSDIEEALDKTKLSHYHGNTSNGKYNDDTGSAYLIEFYDDGYTRLLYQGRFANGLQDDNTGEAWQIARDVDTDYMLYKGVFQNGRQVESEKEADDWDNPIHKSKIDEYTKGKPYESELKWDASHILQ